MSIFKEKVDRRDHSLKRSFEQSNYNYLNNSALPENEIIRQNFNKLFEMYQHGDSERKEILSRIRSQDEVGYYSASFELIINGILKKLGFDVLVHPELNNGCAKRPDFLVTAPDGEKFYLELVTGVENDDIHINKLEERIKNIKQKNPDIYIQHHTAGRFQESKDTDQIIKNINNWIISKDYLEKSFTYTNKNFELKVEVVPKLVDAPFEINGTQIIDNLKLDDQLLSSLEKKSSRYGQLDIPYVIAITHRPSDFSLDISTIINKESISAIERALFGKPNFPEIGYYEKGFWYYIEQQEVRFRNSNVCTVWYFDQLTVERLNQDVNNILYLSPHNNYLYPNCLLNAVYFKRINEFSNKGIIFETPTKYPSFSELTDINN